MTSFIVEGCKESAQGFSDNPPALYTDTQGQVVCGDHSQGGLSTLSETEEPGVKVCRAVHCARRLGGANHVFSRTARVRGA